MILNPEQTQIHVKKTQKELPATTIVGAAPFSARTRHARRKPVVSVILRGRPFKPVVGVAPVTAACSIRTLCPCLDGVSIQDSR